MRIKHLKLLEVLVIILVISIPFNGLKGLEVLGEFKQELSFYILLIGLSLFLMVANRHHFQFPLTSETCVLLFFFFSILASFLVNFETINLSFFKDRGGVGKFVLQFLVFGFSSFLSIFFFFNTTKLIGYSSFIGAIKRGIQISFVLVMGYAIVEIPLVHFSFSELKIVLDIIEPLVRWGAEYKILDPPRIKSVCYEPPFLGMYLVFVFPWLIYFTNSRGKIFIYVLLILLLLIFSGSRTAIVSITVELLIICFLKSNLKKNLVSFSIASMILIVVIATFTNQIVKVFSIDSDATLQTSNITRFGTQIGSFNIFLDNPIVGVGLGQQGYYFSDYYPKFALASYEIQNYISQTNDTWPPGFNLFTRILAELGFVGFILFLWLIFILFKSSFYISNFDFILGKYLIACLSGVILVFLTYDSFRYICFWILVSLIILTKKNIGKISNNNSPF